MIAVVLNRTGTGTVTYGSSGAPGLVLIADGVTALLLAEMMHIESGSSAIRKLITAPSEEIAETGH
jgi:hypothetical protein